MKTITQKHIEHWIEILKALEAFPQNLDEIKTLVNELPLNIYNLSLGSDLGFYRARYDDRFDITKAEEFSYIHSNEKVKLYRYNKDGNPVLYTSTDFNCAYQEIKTPSKYGKDVFISRWIRAKDKELSFAFNLSHRGEDGSNAQRYYDSLQPKYQNCENVMQYFARLGNLLEYRAKEGLSDEQIYQVTAEIAERILSENDAIITVSTKTDELNVTFNKEATDSKLELDSVCWIENPRHHNDRVICVKKIGLPNAADENRIDWYDYTIDEESLVFKEPGSKNDEQLMKEAYKKGGGDKFLFCPIVRESDGMFQGLYINDQKAITIKHKIKLQKIADQ